MAKRRSKKKQWPANDQLAMQRQNTAHPGLLVRVYFQAKKAGLFILVEPSRPGKAEVWLFYDSRSSGRHLASFWPDSMGLAIGSEHTTVHTVFEAMRKVEKLLRRA